MGCDIHAHIEIKVDGEWMYYAPAKIARNYLIFTRMAGVRDFGDVEPIAKPRGLPGDITGMSRLHRESDGVDGHNDSWLTATEIMELVEWAKRHDRRPLGERLAAYGGLLGNYLFGNSIESWPKYQNNPDCYPAYINDVRLVFWFDN